MSVTLSLVEYLISSFFIFILLFVSLVVFYAGFGVMDVIVSCSLSTVDVKFTEQPKGLLCLWSQAS